MAFMLFRKRRNFIEKSATIKLFNTLTGKKETFKPINEGRVGMYHCGPTVYDYPHIGNLRSYIFADILRRMFEANGYGVSQVINITDVGHLSGDADSGEDKMMKALKREGKPITLDAMRELSEFYTGEYVKDLNSLNIKLPRVMPRASDHIDDDISFIKKLYAKGFTYDTSDGVYFDTAKYPEYGHLGNINKINNPAVSRITENPEKKNTRDFALWKLSSVQTQSDDPKAVLGWESPWGIGFPGWHVECSVMARKYLGQPFDIHTGGIDHIPIHHNNEIAQSECAYNAPLANYWMHNEFIRLPGGKKMAKSESNYLTLRTIIDKGIYPQSYRLWVLTGHYRTPLEFSFESLESSHIAYRNLITKMSDWPEGGNISETHYQEFMEYITDDLDTPRCIAKMWSTFKDSALSEKDRLATILAYDEILGLDLKKMCGHIRDLLSNVPERVRKIVSERDTARLMQNWELADKLRKQIEDSGYKLKDTPQGSYLELN